MGTMMADVCLPVASLVWPTEGDGCDIVVDGRSLDAFVVSVVACLVVYALVYALMLLVRVDGFPATASNVYNIAPVFPCLAISIIGFYNLAHQDFSKFTELSLDAAEARISAKSDDAVLLSGVLGGYMAASVIFEFLTNQVLPAYLLHHMCVLMLCVFCHAPYAHSYANFFFGAAEFSTFMLCFYNTFKANKGLQTRFPLASAVSQWVFVAAFLILRLLMWLPLCVLFYMDWTSLWHHGRMSPTVKVAAVVFFIGNVFLTGLQLMWASIILTKMWALFKGTKSERVAKMANKAA